MRPNRTSGERKLAPHSQGELKANWWFVAAAAAGGYMVGSSGDGSNDMEVSTLMGQETYLEAPSVYYGNCSEARAAGAAPVRYGDPGYAPHLDRDNDGVGCE